MTSSERAEEPVTDHDHDQCAEYQQTVYIGTALDLAEGMARADDDGADILNSVYPEAWPRQKELRELLAKFQTARASYHETTPADARPADQEPNRCPYDGPGGRRCTHSAGHQGTCE